METGLKEEEKTQHKFSADRDRPPRLLRLGVGLHWAIFFKLMKKQKFKQRFAKNVFTRFHMSLILLGTILSGIIFSKLLLIFGLQHMMIRFIIVLIFSYLSFFLFMKLWLHYLTTPYRKNRQDESLLDAVDVITSVPDFSSTNSAHSLIGHGGEFGGGGASGAWENVSGSLEIPVSEEMIVSANSVCETTAETTGEAISCLADEGGILLIPLALLLLIVFGGGIYLIYEAPVIISEAAFELILATTLIKKARRIDNPNWMGSVFRATWPAFTLTLVITIIAGWVLMAYCPQATKIKEVFQFCLKT